MKQNIVICLLLFAVLLMLFFTGKLLVSIDGAVSITNSFTENFDKSIEVYDGKSFGKDNQLTFELFRNGTFIIDGKSGHAWQKSDDFRDSAIIRSTNPLPEWSCHAYPLKPVGRNTSANGGRAFSLRSSGSGHLPVSSRRSMMSDATLLRERYMSGA